MITAILSTSANQTRTTDTLATIKLGNVYYIVSISCLNTAKTMWLLLRIITKIEYKIWIVSNQNPLSDVM